MDVGTRNEICKKIRQLKEKPNELSAYESERIIGEILTPLFIEEGYKISNTSRHSNERVNYIAEKDEGTSKCIIGIEYKHFMRPVDTIQVKRLISVANLKAFERVMLLTNSNFTNGARSVAKYTEPVAIELMDLEAIKSWVAKIELETDINKLDVEHILKVISSRFAQIIVKQPSELYKLEWRDLERMIAEVFDGIGFKVELTPGSKDGGKDIILSCKVEGKDKSYIVEIKHWRSGVKVGQDAIKSFLNVIVNEDRNSGLYLSTFGYCNNAFEALTEIERKKIKFGEEEKIVSLCKTYNKIASGIWSPCTNLAEILYEQTI